MKRFAILGHPVAHSLSPKFHNAVFKKLGLKNYIYEFYDCPPKKLSEAIDKIRHGEYQGYSVTIPHKESVIPYLDELSSIARKIGAVNTIIRRKDGTLFGDNTDYAGFKKSLEEVISLVKDNTHGIASPASVVGRLRGRNDKFALILGTGGASKAVQAVLKDLGFQITLASRTKKPGVTTYQELDPEDSYYLIVNTTPVGMSPNSDDSPLTDSRWFRPERVFVDIIYHPKKTKFLQLAQKAGARIIRGDRMFLWQAYWQSQLFTARQLSRAAFQQLSRTLFSTP